MGMFSELCGVLLIALGIICLIWAVVGHILLPGVCPMRAVITGTGGGDGLEQTVKGLLWLRGAGVWLGTVVIEDGGLNRDGQLLAQTLARQDGVEFHQTNHT